jgi:uncharacterized RDD family membrane protein YckC
MTEPATPQGPVPGLDQEGLWGGDADTDGDAPATQATSADLAAFPSAPPDRSARPSAWTQSLSGPASLPAPAGLTFADVPDRSIAFILDLIALAVVGVFLAIVVGGLFGGLVTGGSTAGGAIDTGASDLNIGALLVVGIVAVAVSFAYFTYSWVVLRATPGMRLLGLRIGDQVDGRAISWDQALARWLLVGIAATLLTFVIYVPGLVGPALALMGLAWLAVVLVSVTRSPTNQGFHDRVARTIVVRAVRRAA